MLKSELRRFQAQLYFALNPVKLFQFPALIGQSNRQRDMPAFRTNYFTFVVLPDSLLLQLVPLRRIPWEVPMSRATLAAHFTTVTTWVLGFTPASTAVLYSGVVKSPTD